MTDTEYMTVQSFADHMQVSKGTVRNWMVGGTLPPDTYVRLQDIVRINRARAVAALHAQSVPMARAEDPAPTEDLPPPRVRAEDYGYQPPLPFDDDDAQVSE